MKALKSARTLAASLGVLAGVALAASPAMAFDRVDWTWKVEKYEKEYVDVKVNIDLYPDGLVQVEKLQIFLGNVSADASVYGVYNDPDRTYVKIPHTKTECGWVYGYYKCHEETYYTYEPLALTVAQLPEVKNAASAFGNLQVITSDVPIFLHDGQFVANTYGDASLCDPETALFGLGLALAGIGGNTHTDLAKVFTWGAVTGVLDKAYITANANVGYIANATVDNSAFAAANLIQASIESNNMDNHLFQADITQFAYADVTANAHVSHVGIEGYDLTGLDRPLVNNVATAIGNAVIINVGPVVE